jgi:hypothetical protein
MYNNAFDPSYEYYGIFEHDKNYEYNTSITVNSSPYAVSVDSSKTGAYVESDCTPASENTTCWSGRFLNWLTTRRIDASRRVMVGGKLESPESYAYGESYYYKVVGNNEYGDPELKKSYINSSQYSPIPDGMPIKVYSPPDANGGTIQTSYDPYAKILFGGGLIYDASGDPIGEFDTITINDEVENVPLTLTYNNPIVIAQTPTFSDSEPGTIRIHNVTSDKFQIFLQEWNYLDGDHSEEQISYIVLEAGSHSLPNDIDVTAGVIDSPNEYVDRSNSGCDSTETSTNYQIVNFANTFTSTPVVISSVMTYNGHNTVTSRVWNIDGDSFNIALQEAGAPPGYGHVSERIGYIAFEKGTVDEPDKQWKLKAGSIGSVTDSISTYNLSSFFDTTPSLVAGMQTMNDAESATLRRDFLDKDYIKLHVEEEKSCNSDISHSAEDVGYLALSGGEWYPFNIALAINDRPSGLLQKLADRARIGISFYRYNPNARDIYYDNNVDGGTLRFMIPINPFVKMPTDTSLPVAEKGYRQLDGYIGTASGDIVDAVNSYPLVWGTTPIAENLWEMVQYFSQTNPYYNDYELAFELSDNANPERDPFYYPDYNKPLYCANPSVLIFTDGFPYRDANIPSNLVDYDEDSHAADETSNHGEDNLDDVAFWAFCDKSKGSCPVPGTPDDGSRDLRPLLQDDQYLTIYTVGFADGNIRPVLQDTADNAGGLAYAAADGKSLETALNQALTAAVSRASASAVAVNSGSITGSSKLYQAIFDSIDWSGDIEAYQVNLDGSIAAHPVWISSDQLPATNAHVNRRIITYNGTSGIPFQWYSISASQQTQLVSENVLNYLRGDTSNEETQGGSYRDRNKLIGDIINSAPVWVGGPGMHYPDNWGDNEPETSIKYSSFKSDKRNRTPVVYVGSNDGMMHAFHADTGYELFAYVPAKVYENLPNLTKPNYPHQYFVDGSPVVIDAFFSGSWHTVLMAGLNAGGQGVYALDVTEPSNFTSDETAAASNVLWEFDDSDDVDLGYSFSQPNIVRLQDGSWAAVFGNGYNNTANDSHVSTTGNAVLYILDIATGTILKKLDTGIGSADDPTGNGRPNGLSTVAPVDVTGDSIIDYIYGGDLFGNLWKFDLNNTNTTQWDVAYTGPIFSACDRSPCNIANPQPITSRPQVGPHPRFPGYMIYFGTGKYFEHNDDSSVSQITQSFYGIWDKNEDRLSNFDRGDLLQQEIIEEISLNGSDYRITTENLIDWTSHMGWYIDLINTESGNTDNKGERQVTASILREGRIIFTTLIPEDDPCSAGGTGWLMELDAKDGSHLDFSPFDVDGDGNFDEDDYIQATVDVNGDGRVDENDKVPGSGIKSQVGIIPMPAILANDDEEYKYTPGTTGDIQTVRENPGPSAKGRQSWSELWCK